MTLLDRIPELDNLLVDLLAFLMDLHDDEGLTLDDLAERVPEVPALLDDADDFLYFLESDGYLEAMLDDWSLDAHPRYWVDEE